MTSHSEWSAYSEEAARRNTFYGFLAETRCTQREIDIMMLLFDGDTEQHIADRLGIETKSVQRHRQRATRKLLKSSPFCNYYIGEKT